MIFFAHTCGLFILMQMATKDAVAQEIVAHEGIYKAAKLLDQFCDGLQALRLLSLM